MALLLIADAEWRLPQVSELEQQQRNAGTSGSGVVCAAACAARKKHPRQFAMAAPMEMLRDAKGIFVKQTKKGCIQELLGCEATNEFLIFPDKDIYTRIDVSYTREGSGVYFFIGEAF